MSSEAMSLLAEARPAGADPTWHDLPVCLRQQQEQVLPGGVLGQALCSQGPWAVAATGGSGPV